MNSKELVLKTLEGRNTNGRAPRQLWTLPYAEQHFPEQLKNITSTFQNDIVEVPPEAKQYRTKPQITGDFYELGEYIDEWGCQFTNLQKGIVGEVKKPIIVDEEWGDAKDVHIPEELLTIDTEKINEYCAGTDQFVLASDIARPFERLQFLRGTENLFMDFAYHPLELYRFSFGGKKQKKEPFTGENSLKTTGTKIYAFIEKMHDFYKRLLEVWAGTDVDGLFFMDDWGTQLNLLISPDTWKALFMPMYRDYSDIAKKYGKKIFFHSDGNIEKIIPYLIDIGIDAVNSQVFCMGPENLAQYQGKITFWGEVDRQNILPYGSKDDVKGAVKRLYDAFWKNGGAIAQCEFGIGADPNNVYTVFETWDQLTGN
ncbi:uroporphyrinogen decarboxylase family protein [Christensenella hongkongensis]|nr:uroporphyrinogen decarboxylase family protein [Christensenella hongkongensis]TCW27890.1 uroporphyrinogen decarboxylase [Christensenella hongkongensis]